MFFQPARNATDILASLEAKTDGHGRKKSNPGTKQKMASSGSMFRAGERIPTLELISHQDPVFSTNCVDVTIVLRSDSVVSMRTKLILVRFSGEEEEVPNGTLVQKFPQNHFVVRLKLPIARMRFEVRIFTSTTGSPKEHVKHPLKYVITTGKECQSLLPSLDDPRKKKYGFVQLDPSAHLHGIVVIAPMTRRLSTGKVYFLVYVDRSQALAGAEADLEKVQKRLNEGKELSQAKPLMERNKRLYNERLQLQELSESDLLCDAAKNHRSTVRTSADKLDLDDRAESPPLKSDAGSPMSPASPKQRRGSGGTGRSKTGLSTASAATGGSSVGAIQKNLCALLEKTTQDTTAAVQLDVALRGGDVIYQLRQRCDFPDLYEGIFSFGEQDVEATVELHYRFPLTHAYEFAPRKLGEWMVVKDEVLPPNF